MVVEPMIAFDPLSSEERVRIVDLHPEVGDLRAEAIEGLRRSEKALPCKYFYDALGARLFEAVTELPEYYPTRTELGIMSRAVHEMAESIGPHATLVEFGSGVGLKTQRLLDALIEPSGCVLIDISRAALEASAYQLADRYDEMEVIAVCADYTQPLRLPRPHRPSSRTVAYFPGSTIGNFTRDEAISFLGRVADLVGQGGGLLVGIDRKKDPKLIEAAYNDALGVTAAFNLNILRRLNQNGASFDLGTFRHHAPYVESEGRIEMRLVSKVDQSVRIGGAEFGLSAGEHIVTEHSHKYDLKQFGQMASAAGFRLTRQWSDERDWFSVCFLEVEGA
ncbi:MAG: L-histidine N(alpha)-methyltransferase [Deltaproteobacteria bacterium]|nr:L-histidine N(alpha)-methyltransferase [Deltaproteobacteria bacterium]